MDPGFDENEAEFRVLVLAIALKMLADRDGLTFISAIFPSLDRRGEMEWDRVGLMLPS